MIEFISCLIIQDRWSEDVFWGSDHERLIMENITKTCQEVPEKLEKGINVEAKKHPRVIYIDYLKE